MAALDASAAGGNARTTNDPCNGRVPRRSRTMWRNRLVTRCLTTELPTALLTTNPTVVWTTSGRGKAYTTTVRRAALRPRRVTRRKSSPRVSRAAGGSTAEVDPVRPTASRAPCGGERRGSRGRRGCACAGGSRASWPGDGCWAGRFACSRSVSSTDRLVVVPCHRPSTAPLAGARNRPATSGRLGPGYASVAAPSNPPSRCRPSAPSTDTPQPLGCLRRPASCGMRRLLLACPFLVGRIGEWEPLLRR
jgi:hypothetical protein